MYTRPFASTPRPPLVSVGSQRLENIVWLVDEALANTDVEDAVSAKPVAPKCTCVVVELET